MSFFSKIDQFGVPLKLKTTNGNTTYKSKLGGIITIVIYTLCLLYAILIIYNWRTGSIPPKIINTITMTGESQFIVSEGDIKLSFEYLEQNIFSSKGNIITPVVMGYDIDQKKTPLFFESNIIILNKFTLVQTPMNDQNKNKNSGLFLALIRCNPTFLTEGQYCASDSEIDNFLSTFSEITKLQIALHQFDQKLHQITKINKQIFIPLEKEFLLSTQINLKTTKQLQDRNIFVEGYDETDYISNFEYSTQIVTSQFMKRNVLPDALTVIFITLDALQTQTVIVYPKMGEILASIGSIVSIIFSLKIIVESFNSFYLNQELVNFIISIKYPKLNDLVLERNILGKIVKVKYNQKELELERFISKYDQVRREASQYLQLTKIIEILIDMQLLNRKDESVDKGADEQYVQEHINKNQIQPFQPENNKKLNHNQQSQQESLFELEKESVTYIFK